MTPTHITIRKNTYGEYVVRVWTGKTRYRAGKADYYTDSKEDAYTTARDMQHDLGIAVLHYGLFPTALCNRHDATLACTSEKAQVTCLECTYLLSV